MERCQPSNNGLGMTTSMQLGKVSRRKWCGVEHLLTGYDMVCNSLFFDFGQVNTQAFSDVPVQ